MIWVETATVWWTLPGTRHPPDLCYQSEGDFYRYSELQAHSGPSLPTQVEKVLHRAPTCFEPGDLARPNTPLSEPSEHFTPSLWMEKNGGALVPEPVALAPAD